MAAGDEPCAPPAGFYIVWKVEELDIKGWINGIDDGIHMQMLLVLGITSKIMHPVMVKDRVRPRQ